MLRKIHIENFKSLQNVTLDLQRINLLIGPNNSGKSNFLKAIKYVLVNEGDNDKNLNFKKYSDDILVEAIVNLDEQILDEQIQMLDYSFEKRSKRVVPNSQSQIQTTLLSNLNDLKGLGFVHRDPQRSSLTHVVIYRPNPNSFTGVYALSKDEFVNDDCSNLVPFLFNLGQNNRKLFRQIEDGLKECVGDLVGIGTPAVEVEGVSKLRLKFFDKNDNDFWADEVSEGVLYFLALLCIVHQPNPPKLLLLEEPERGIHPRRIQEVMDFIFHLAETKDIQVIMTTHHERVVDYFADIPESVFVFDKNEEGATQVKNLKNIIEISDTDREKDGLPKIDFTASLGEHWAAGFMGGVPK